MNCYHSNDVLFITLILLVPPPPMNVQRQLSVIEEDPYLELEGADPFLMSPPAIDTVSYHSVAAVSFKGNDGGGETKDQYEINREQQQQVCLFVCFVYIHSGMCYLF